MTREALLFIAMHQCPTLPMPEVLGPVMVAYAQHENHPLDPLAVNHNPNGTYDMGIAQVNSRNFGWTGLKDWRDPCQNLTAAAKVWFARYNGNPPDELKALYAAGMFAKLGVRQSQTATVTEVQPDEAPALEDVPGQPETLQIGG